MNDFEDEIRELDELNEEPLTTFEEDEVYSLDELSDRMIGVTSLLNHIDKYKDFVSEMRRRTDWKILDIMHFLEDDISSLTLEGYINGILTLHNLRETRRTLKISDSVIYEFQKNNNRLNNEGNRSNLIHNVMLEMKNLSKPYRNRIYTVEELNKLFTGELINPEIKPILDGLVLEYYHKHLLTQEEQTSIKPKRGRPKKSETIE